MPDYLSALTSRLSWKVAAYLASGVAVVAIGLSAIYWAGTVARDLQLAKKDAQISEVKGKLMACQTDLSAARSVVDTQNSAIVHLGEKAKEAERRATAERKKMAEKQRLLRIRAEWLKAQNTDLENQCAGSEDMLDAFIISKQKEH